MSEKIEKLKLQWNEYSKKWNGEDTFKNFINKYPKSKLKELNLEEYTNIKTNDNDEYFTLWLERKTENCGKFRTASSFSYGIYKVNPNNIQDEAEKKNSYDKYKAFDENMKKSKDYLDQTKAKQYFEERIKPLIIKLANFEELTTTRPLDINYARKIAYMYNVDKLIPIFKKEVLEAIAEFFDVTNEIDFSSYKATESILKKIKVLGRKEFSHRVHSHLAS